LFDIQSPTAITGALDRTTYSWSLKNRDALAMAMIAIQRRSLRPRELFL